MRTDSTCRRCVAPEAEPVLLVAEPVVPELVVPEVVPDPVVPELP
jgi:hypothetical protein